MKPNIFALSLLVFFIWCASAQSILTDLQDDPQLPRSSAIHSDQSDPPAHLVNTTSLTQFLDGGFRTLLHLSASDSLRVVSRSTDQRGNVHIRTQQLFRGIPVFGSWYSIHSKKGVLSATNGTIYHRIEAPTVPAITETDALNKALAALPASRYAWQDERFIAALRQQEGNAFASFFPRGELVITPGQLFPATDPDAKEPSAPEEQTFHLAWCFDIFAIEPDLKRERIFIDATTGSLLYSLPQMANCSIPALGKAAYRPGLVEITTDSCHNASASRYQLYDREREIWILDSRHTGGTPLLYFFNNTKLWTPPQADTVAVAALYGMELWYNYLLEQFGWYGMSNDMDKPIQVWVHFQQDFENAVYSGFILVGDGNPNGKWKHPLVSRDILAHEATHGLIEHTSPLLYVYEPGILNEAIADIFACLVELEQGDGNWILGEDILPNGSRRFDNPNSVGLPDTYRGNFWINQSAPDQALHHNSTVLGHWFYLLAEGGDGINDNGTAYMVQGIGRDQAAELLFHAMRYHFLNPNDGFHGARRGMMKAAADLNWNQRDIDNLAMSWCAIGVGECTTEGKGNITLLAPLGGEDYHAGDPIEVRWMHTSGIKKVKILFSANQGASWQDLAYLTVSGTGGSMTISAPNVNSELCLMRVTALDDPLAFDDNPAPFSISGCSLLSSFSLSQESACYGTDFVVTNTSPDREGIYIWKLNGQDYPAARQGFRLASLSPGLHTITLIARDEICVDSFSRTIQVAPVPTAEFSYSVSNQLVSAAAVFPSAERYIWSVNGQALNNFQNAQSISWESSGVTEAEICLFIEDNCTDSGAQVCKTVTFSLPVDCAGTEEIWKQYNNLSDIIDMAEYGDTLILSTTGGLVLWDKNSRQSVRVFNTASSPALPCTELGSVAVDRARKWVYVALKPGQGFVRLDLSTNEVTHFTNWNLPELLSNDITVLRVAPTGSLWIGTADKGVWVGIPGLSFQRTYLQELPQNNVIDIDFSPSGPVWIAMSNSLAKIENNAVVESYSGANSPLPEGPSPGVNTLMAEAGTLWLGARNGLHRLQNGSWQTFTSADYDFPSDYIVDIERGEDSKLIFGLYLNSSIMEFDGSTFVRRGCLYDAATTGAGGIRRFVVNPDKVWIGCKNGLYSWDEVNQCQTYQTSDFALFRNKVDNIFVSRDGTAYVIEEQSIVKVKDDILTPLNIVSYLPFGPSYLAYLNLIGMAEDDDGVIWVALDFYEYRLARISPLTGAWQFFGIEDLPFTTHLSVYESDFVFHDHRIHLSTEGSIFVLDPNSGDWTSWTTENSPIWSYGTPNIEFDAAGNMWLANGRVRATNNQSDRLLKFDGQNWETIPVNASAVGAFKISPDGTIWAIAANKLQKYQDGTWTTLQPISNLISSAHLSASDLSLDSQGNIWLVTINGGAYKIDTEGNVLERYTSCNSGLINEQINKVVSNPLTGSIWFATQQGAAQYLPSSGFIQAAFDQSAIACVGYTTSFSNITAGATSWEWSINGMPVSTERNLNHTFATAGEYIVELTAFNAEGCSTSSSRPVTVYPTADTDEIPEQIIACDASWEICAPENMARYAWKKGAQLVGTGQCLTVEQNQGGAYQLEVTDHCGYVESTTFLIALSGACVYPGDADNNGIVDYRDVLWLGYAFGYQGPARQEKGVNWIEYPAIEWNGNLPVGTNLKYTDCDGTGYVDLSDFKAIESNYLKTHGGYANLPVPEQSPYAFIPELIKIDTSLGDNRYQLSIRIMARHANHAPIDNFYGVGMRMYYVLPEGMEVVGSPEFSFAGNSLGIDGKKGIGMVKSFPDRRFTDVVAVKLDHLNQSDVDTLGIATFVVVDDHLPIFDSLRFTLQLVGNTAITNDGNFIPIKGGESTFNFAEYLPPPPPDSTNFVYDPELAQKVRVYPNPTSGQCRIAMNIPSVREVVLQVHNAQGTEVWTAVRTGQTAFVDLDTSNWPAGLYWLRVQADGRLGYRKMVKI